MKTKHLAVGLLMGLSAAVQAVDLSKVPAVSKKDLILFNDAEINAGRRPHHCGLLRDRSRNDPVCYDGVLSLKEAVTIYGGENFNLGKPLEKGNKAKENLAGLDKVINRIGVVYGGTEQAILDKEPDLNLVLAGLFNVFNNAITDVEPYVLSIAKGHYDKKTLDKLDQFMTVFQNGWNKSSSAMIKFNGITRDKAEKSTAYYIQELKKVRHIITQLNKYYQ